MWTINDFPAYADLSGWPNRGVKACHVCMHSTRSRWLYNGKKFCYMGRRRYLPMDHPWRRNKRAFDGTQERECAPDVQNGDDILGQLEGMVFGDESTGKTKEKKQTDGTHGRPNLKDTLQVPDRATTRSRTKNIKEAMQGLVKSTWAKFANLSSKTPTFNMGLKEEEQALIHMIQATDGGGIS